LLHIVVDSLVEVLTHIGFENYWEMVAVPLALVAALYWLHVKMWYNLRSNEESKYQDSREPNLRTPSSCRGCELLQLQEDNEDIYRLTNRFYLEQLCHD
jgi:hypothetical protein